MQSLALLALAAALVPTPVQPGKGSGVEEVVWRAGGLERAVELARASGTPILLEFSADGCPWCARLHREAWVEREVVEELGNWTCVRLDLTVDAEGVVASQEAAELGNRFAVGRFPTLVALLPDGTPEDVVAGFLKPSAMLEELRRIRGGEGTLSALEARVAADASDHEARYALALKRYSLGDPAGYDRELATIRRADPEGRSVPMRRMAIAQMREEMFGCMRGARPVDPDPLVEFLEDEEHPSLACEGWSVLATVHRHLGDPNGMVEAWRSAWDVAPDDERAATGNALAWDFWMLRAKLDPEELAFALEASEEACTLLGDARGDDALRAAYLDTLACCYLMNGRRDRAVETMQECVRLAPSTPEYVQRLAEFRAER